MRHHNKHMGAGTHVLNITPCCWKAQLERYLFPQAQQVHLHELNTGLGCQPACHSHSVEYCTGLTTCNSYDCQVPPQQVQEEVLLCNTAWLSSMHTPSPMLGHQGAICKPPHRTSVHPSLSDITLSARQKHHSLTTDPQCSNTHSHAYLQCMYQPGICKYIHGRQHLSHPAKILPREPFIGDHICIPREKSCCAPTASLTTLTQTPWKVYCHCCARPIRLPLPAQACWTQLLLSPQRMITGLPINPTWREAERPRRGLSGLFARTRRPASR